MADFRFFLNRQGVQGRKGEKGDTGFSPTISVGTDTLDEYKLIIANESNTFETPNLRGNINIQDNGGTYLRYDTETKQISAQSMDAATADTVGGVRLSTEADIVEMGAGSVVTPSDVADALPLYLEGEGAVTITQDELTSKTKIKVAKTDLATTESAGIVKVDGTSITVTADGTISASPSGALPIASTTQLGGVKVDGTSIVADENGVISSVSGGGGTGDVTASGNNTFTGDNTFRKSIRISNSTDPFQRTFVNYNGLGIGTTSEAEIKVQDNQTLMPLKFIASKLTLSNTYDGSSESPIVTSDKLKAGENITLNKNAETGDITISSTGGGGGSIPTNMVTTDTDQTITGNKTFSTSTTVAFGAGSAMTTINRNSVKIGNPANYVLDISNTSLRDESGNYTIDAGCISSKTGNINIIPNWSTQSRGDGLLIQENKLSFNGSEVVTKSDIATNTTAGIVKVDGTSVTIDSNGVISATGGGGDVPIATTETTGKVKPDGTTITVTEDGTISAVPTTPTNMVTTDTSQRITGAKTFTEPTVFKNTLDMLTGGTDTLYVHATGSYAEGYTTNIDVDKNLNIKTRLSGGAITLAPYNSSLNALKYKNSSNTSNPSYDILHTGNLVTGNNITISEPNSTGVRTISGPSNDYMASMAFPSNNYVNLELGASGATYTAPADGYVSIIARCTTAANSLFELTDISGGYRTIGWSQASTNVNVQLFLPVRKNHTFRTVYNNSFTTEGGQFRFFYAEGSQPTA